MSESDIDLDRLFKTFRASAFRLETLPSYDVPEEASDLAAFIAGEPLPPSRDEEWLGFVRDAVSQDKRVERVRLIPPTLTLYLKFEIEWGYVFNADAGEEIRFLPANRSGVFATDTARDFWLFDEATAVEMIYDENGAYLGVSEVSESDEVMKLRKLRSDVWGSAITLKDFLEAYRSGRIC